MMLVMNVSELNLGVKYFLSVRIVYTYELNIIDAMSHDADIKESRENLLNRKKI